MSTTKRWTRLEKSELIIATIVYVFALISAFQEGRGESLHGFFAGRLPWMIKDFVEVSSIYCALILLHFYLLPGLLGKSKWGLYTGIMVIVFALITTLFLDIRVAVITFGSFAIYSAIRYGLIFVDSKTDEVSARYKFIAPGVLVALSVWMVALIFFIISEADLAVVILWTILMPFAIGIYSYSFFILLPRLQTKRHPFVMFYFRVVVFMLAFGAITGVLLAGVRNNPHLAVSIVAVNTFFQLFITAPFSWISYQRNKHRVEEMSALQKELGRSEANIDLLKSQINPHFLFNVLNTLYGTALQEKADRTSEGIQRLGDMMRFMLQENLQEKISLAREIEYLRNYISLQELRTGNNSSITIQTDIKDIVGPFHITPMLLIPFVENAFKHGISFREPSFIRISMSIDKSRLDFTCVNTNHTKSENDPEKYSPGIGLNNVKQRLKLHYPGKHDLTIQESEKEFFVHLAIELM